jgi:hypothetical protein
MKPEELIEANVQRGIEALRKAGVGPVRFPDEPSGLRLNEGLGCNAPAVARERPVLFSAPMVRALRDGTKTQTRRAVKGWPLEWLLPPIRFSPEYVALPESQACPYGQPGDRLWVREAWRTDPQFDYLPPRDLDSAVAPVQYEAGPHADVLGGKLRPSMFMPRWACRLVLTLESVRVERLNDISEADALAEGVTPKWEPGCSGRLMEAFSGFSFRPAASAYADLWEQINGPGSWSANPWVWVLAFRCGPNLQPNVRAKSATTE